jgi:hypothetical protein
MSESLSSASRKLRRAHSRTLRSDPPTRSWAKTTALPLLPRRGAAGAAVFNPMGEGLPPDPTGERAPAVIPPSNRPVGSTVRGDGVRPDRNPAASRSRRPTGEPALSGHP